MGGILRVPQERIGGLRVRQEWFLGAFSRPIFMVQAEGVVLRAQQERMRGALIRPGHAHGEEAGVLRAKV